MELVSWMVVSDSKSVLVTSDVLTHEEGSVGGHSRLDLESNSVSQWELWIVVSLGVVVPLLVLTIVALIPVEVSVMRVVSTVDIKASSNNISDVLSVSSEPSGLLVNVDVGVGMVGSDSSSVTVVSPVLSIVLDGDNVVSVGS